MTTSEWVGGLSPAGQFAAMPIHWRDARVHVWIAALATYLNFDLVVSGAGWRHAAGAVVGAGFCANCLRFWRPSRRGAAVFLAALCLDFALGLTVGHA